MADPFLKGRQRGAKHPLGGLYLRGLRDFEEFVITFFFLIYMYVCMNTHTCIYVYVYMCVVYVYMNVFACMYIHKYFLYTHTHTESYVSCVRVRE